MTEVLGERLHIAAWSLKGTLPPERLANVLRAIVNLIGMSDGGMAPVVKQYPLPTGKGGTGHTIYLPFGNAGLTPTGWWSRFRLRLASWILGRQHFASLVFQPLVESFIVSDDYPDLDKTYIVLASCKPFVTTAASRYLAKMIGPVLNVIRFEL